MRTCPACRKQIDVKATKCPYCQTVFDGMQMEDGRRERAKHQAGTIVFVIIAALLVIFWLSQPGTIESIATWSAGAS